MSHVFFTKYGVFQKDYLNFTRLFHLEKWREKNRWKFYPGSSFKSPVGTVDTREVSIITNSILFVRQYASKWDGDVCFDMHNSVKSMWHNFLWEHCRGEPSVARSIRMSHCTNVALHCNTYFFKIEDLWMHISQCSITKGELIHCMAIAMNTVTTDTVVKVWVPCGSSGILNDEGKHGL